MDWFSWLSKTTLDPYLICEYGLVFEQNELESDDLPYFDHEFLHSMGISVAKHRLEILKLAGKQTGSSGPTGLSKLVTAINRTKKNIKKRFSKLVSLPAGEPERAAAPEPELRTPAVVKRRQTKSGPLDFTGVRREGTVYYSKSKSSLQLSGPLDGKKAEQRLVVAYRSRKDGCRSTPPSPAGGGVMVRQVSPRMGSARTTMEVGRSRSTMVRSANATPTGGRNHGGGGDGGAVEFDERSLWTALFQNMKPT